MRDNSRFSHLILKHWKQHWPLMVEELERNNRLPEALEQAETLAMDRLYHLLFVEKMQYQSAWEIAMQDWLLPDETSPSSKIPQSKPPLATSG